MNFLKFFAKNIFFLSLTGSTFFSTILVCLPGNMQPSIGLYCSTDLSTTNVGIAFSPLNIGNRLSLNLEGSLSFNHEDIFSNVSIKLIPLKGKNLFHTTNNIFLAQFGQEFLDRSVQAIKGYSTMASLVPLQQLEESEVILRRLLESPIAQSKKEDIKKLLKKIDNKKRN